MSEYEKKSLVKFLGLYLGSAFVFITVIAVMLYSIKIENLSELSRQKLKNYSSSLSADIIDSHMRGNEFKIPKNEEFKVALIGQDDKTIYTQLPSIPQLTSGFYELNGSLGIVDGSPRLHHGVKYIVVQGDPLSQDKKEAAYTALWVWLSSMALVCALAVTLSRQFLKPIRKEIEKLDNFVKASAHELNTPITTLVLSLDGLKNEVKDTSKIEHLKASAKMLSKIHEDLTYYLQRETLKKEEQWIDFLELSRQRAAFYAKVGSSKNISVNAEGESFLFRMDATAAARLIDNLLSNAVKYSKNNGKVKIKVSQNLIEVEDEGIGMGDAARQKIFEKFTRATEIGGGFGLGLYIVKTVCDDYGIKIEVQSEEGKGSWFKLIF